VFEEIFLLKMGDYPPNEIVIWFAL